MSVLAHGIGIRHKSDKVLAYAKRNKRWVLCEIGHSPEDHDCRRSHTGTSKSMEAAIAVEIFTKNPMLKQEGVEISTIIGDDDSSTIAQIRRVRVSNWKGIGYKSCCLHSQKNIMVYQDSEQSYRLCEVLLWLRTSHERERWGSGTDWTFEYSSTRLWWPLELWISVWVQKGPKKLYTQNKIDIVEFRCHW